MTRRRDEWRELLVGLGQALIDLAKAESAALVTAWKRFPPDLGWALGFFVVAGVLAAWGIGIATAFLVALFGIWLPWWGATLAVTGLWFGGAATAVLLGVWRWKRIEWPQTTFRRHVEDHVAWWEREALPRARREKEGETP